MMVNVANLLSILDTLRPWRASSPFCSLLLHIELPGSYWQLKSVKWIGTRDVFQCVRLGIWDWGPALQWLPEQPCASKPLGSYQCLSSRSPGCGRFAQSMCGWKILLETFRVTEQALWHGGGLDATRPTPACQLRWSRQTVHSQSQSTSLRCQLCPALWNECASPRPGL